jgi:hypothetical protein
MSTSDVQVGIFVSTSRRPSGLACLLGSLRQLRMDKFPDVAVHIVNVDNDLAGSAKPVVARIAALDTRPVSSAMRPRGRMAVIGQLVTTARVAGLLAGKFRNQIEEYRHTHGNEEDDL